MPGFVSAPQHVPKISRQIRSPLSYHEDTLLVPIQTKPEALRAINKADDAADERRLGRHPGKREKKYNRQTVNV